MSDPVPLSLFHTGRAQCPDCGAPLALTEGHAMVDCTYCGGTAVVERRLRTIEPVPGDFVTADAPAGSARSQRPASAIRGIAQDDSHCPACGSALDAAEAQAIRRCPHCRAESKIERRLSRRTDAGGEIAAMERAAPDFERRRFAKTESLVERIESTAALKDRVRAAHELTDGYDHVNPAAARLLPRIMAVLKTCEAPLDIPLAEMLGKLLCDGDARLARAVLMAAEKFTFDIAGPRSVLWQLGLGEGICLKLLLDTADFAAARGANEYACAALWAVNCLFERNYARRITLAEIVMYRLLYLRGPVQAWALEVMQGQMGLGVRFPTPTLLRFIDDCACERPELVSHLLKCFYQGAAKNESEYLDRLGMVDILLTPQAKSAAMGQLFAAPRDIPEPKLAGILECLLAHAADPALNAGAVKAINDIIEDSPGPREAVHDLVRSHGESLPDAVRRCYLNQVPGCKSLKSLPPDYWQPDRPGPLSPFDEQLATWKQMWRGGIDGAVKYQRDRQAEARCHWEENK